MFGGIRENFKIGTKHEVNVTEIVDPHYFYIQPCNWEPRLLALENRPHIRDPDPDSITYGMIVLYKSKQMKKIIRGKIVYMKLMMGVAIAFNFIAVDYGFFETDIPIGDVGKLPFLCEHPPLAIHCQLYQCEPKGKSFTPDVAEHFKGYLNSNPIIVTVTGRTHNRLMVQVKTKDIDDLATLMCLLDYTVFWKPKTDDDTAMGLDVSGVQFHHKLQKPGATFLGRIQGGESLEHFYIAELSEYRKFVNLQAGFSMDCENKQLPMDKIVPGQHCAVQINESTYERAIIQEITEPNDAVTVFLVDLGQFHETTFTCIKSAESEIFSKHPIMALFCRANVDQMREHNLPTTVIPGYEYLVKIVLMGSGFDTPHQVYLYPANY